MQLSAEGLGVRRGEDFLFRNLSFTLRSGEALVLKGANGSGKSTLLRTIAGLIHPEEGKILTDREGRAAESCHYLGHRNAMKLDLTVAENLLFWKRFLGDAQGGTGLSPEEAADAIGLGAITHLPFGYLSQGQQRRFAMAKLLVAHRPIWILDEPTAALDARSETLFATLMNNHMSSGGLVIAATHQPLALGNARDLVMPGFSAFRDDDPALEAYF